ncbi:MAG: membrane protein insertase YidC [Oscillospiraceae bacterium]|nr:membrane protein insertase YidC [Oscillospiraceae bacterium]
MFNAIARPFGWLLMNLYDLFQNYALALLFVAVIVRVILLPFQMKGKRGMLRQTRLQPKIADLQKRHGANKQKLNEEMARLYKEEGVNPASGCLWSFIQMPIMIAMFYAIRQPLSLMMGVARDLWEEGGAIYEKLVSLGSPPDLEGFYAEVYITQEISRFWDAFKDMGIEGLQKVSFMLGELNLTQIPDWQFFWNPETDWSGSAWVPGLILFMFPIISGGAQFVSAHIMRKMNASPTPEGTAANVMKFMPLLSVWFGFMFPAALSMYWTIGTVLQIGQDIWLTKKYTKILDEEDAEREKVRKVKEAELEAKRIETERLKAEGLAERNRNTSKRKKQKSDKQDQIEKAAEWEKKNAPAKEEKEDENEPGRVGKRRYARGRAYDPNRYSSPSDDFENDDAYTGYEDEDEDDDNEDYDEDDDDNEDYNDDNEDEEDDNEVE